MRYFTQDAKNVLYDIVFLSYYVSRDFNLQMATSLLYNSVLVKRTFVLIWKNVKECHCMGTYITYRHFALAISILCKSIMLSCLL